MPDAAGRASYLAYRAGAEIARALPPALALPIARAASRGMTRVWRGRHEEVERNVRRVLGSDASARAVRDATAEVFANYARYWQEMFRLSRERPDSFDARVDDEGYEHVVDACRLGGGAILALPHLGNWDLAGAWMAARGHGVTTVAEPVQPRELFDWFVAERAKVGMEVVALGPGSVTELLRALTENKIVALVCDRDLAQSGVPVDFFGAPTTMPGGPATLALRTGAPLLPVGAYFLPDGRQRIQILAPVPAERSGRLRDDVARVTQDLARRFEALIRVAPGQWLMMQPMWPASSPAPDPSPPRAGRVA